MPTSNSALAHRALLFIVVATTTSACASIPTVGTPGVPDGYPIEEVKVEGVEAVDHAELVNGLANRPPDGLIFKDYFRYDEIQTELDRRRIRSFYERAGYFGVTIEGPKLERIGDNYDRWRVLWKVDEGAPAKVERLILGGAPDELKDRLTRASGLHRGQIYDSAKFDAASTQMRAVLVREGYAGATVEGRVQIVRADGAAAVVFDIDAGPKLKIHELVVSGATATPERAVLVRKTWEDGEVFDPRDLEQLRGRLYAIDHYSGVRLDYETPRDDQPDYAIIRASVSEAETNELQIGVGGGFDPANLFLRSRLRYKRRNVFELTNASIEFVPAVQILRDGDQEPKFTPEVRFGLVNHDLFIPMLRTEFDIGYQFQQLEAYAWRGFDVGIGIGRSLFDDLVDVSVGARYHAYEFEEQRIAGPNEDRSLWNLVPAGLYADNQSPQDVLGIASPQSVVAVTPAIAYDGRDDVLEPTRGWFVRAELELGFGTGDTGAGFTLLHPEVRAYLPLFANRLIFAGRVNFATNLAGQLPAARRLYAGGAASQRGFPQRRLSPSATKLKEDPDTGARVVDTDEKGPKRIPVGGETLLETNLEARIRIFKLFGFWVGAVLFVDGADIGVSLTDLKIPDLHYASGVGARYLTPIGAIRFDWGVRLNRTNEGEISPCTGVWECSAFHFSLGQAF